MNIGASITLGRIKKEQIPAAIAFMADIRREVFPMLQEHQLTMDISEFERYDMEPEGASFFVAADENDRVVGSIGVQRYDDRIEAIRGNYRQERVAEIVRCYVCPTARRMGIGSYLFREAANFSKKAGYSKLYLHTHHFLPGAVTFWQRQGFSILLDQRDDWQTVHMERSTSRVEY